MSNTESDQSPLTPGQLLSSARKEQDITVETIAQGLRLDPLLIKALENDEYEKFPAMAYVRGYLRGYASLVEINPNQLVSTFDKKINAAPTLEPFASRPEQQAGSGDRHIRVVTYSLIGVLLLLLGLWWQTQRSPSTKLFDKVINKTDAEEQDIEKLDVMEGTSGELSLPAFSDGISQDNPQATELTATGANVGGESPAEQLGSEAEAAEVDTSESVETEIEQTSELASGEVAEESVLDITETTERSEPEVDTEPVDTETDAEEVSEKQAEEEPQAAPAVDNNGIVMTFTDDSWIQITDAAGKKRFSRLGKSGEVVNIGGEQPYKVIIGKASAVSMSYQGKKIDLKSLAKDEVARFVIDKTGAHQ